MNKEEKEKLLNLLLEFIGEEKIKMDTPVAILVRKIVDEVDF